MGSNDTLMAHPHGQFRKVKRHITFKRKLKHSGTAQVIAWRKLKRRAGRIIEARHKNKHRSINCKRKLKSSTNWSPSESAVSSAKGKSMNAIIYISPSPHHLAIPWIKYESKLQRSIKCQRTVKWCHPPFHAPPSPSPNERWATAQRLQTWS